MFRPPGTHISSPKFPKIALEFNELESAIYNLVYIGFMSNAFFQNLKKEEDLYRNFTCQGISFVILVENYIGIIIVQC